MKNNKLNLPDPRDAENFRMLAGILATAGAQGRFELLQAEVYQLCGIDPGQGQAPAPAAVPFGAGVSVGLNMTREFGMIIRAGLSAADLAVCADSLPHGQVVISAVTALTDADQLLALFRESFSYRLIARRDQAGSAPVNETGLRDLFGALIALGNLFAPENTAAEYMLEVLDLHIMVRADGQLNVLSGSGSFNHNLPLPAPPPVAKIHRMLHPESIGIIGVSATKMNFGRIILNNIIGSGYDKDKLLIIRPGEEQIDGIRCVASLSALEHKLDLFVVAVTADAVYDLVDEVIATNAAESVMLIPGGLGETRNSREPTRKMIEKIRQARKQGDGDGVPVFLGGNCLGIVSHPGNYDTWFIPLERLPKPQKRSNRNSALISQSGAFMVTRLSKNAWLDPAYMTAVGNQNDISHSDMVRYFLGRDEIDVIGMYIEGFNDMDGLAYARAVREAVIRGKQVIVYKAGISLAGQNATMGHTASVAGDYTLCETVLSQAGAIVAHDFSEFSDLYYIATCMHDKTVGGKRLGAISGAGFESVGMADSIMAGDFSLDMAVLEEATVLRCAEILRSKKLDALMEVRNPFDINPGADDDAHLLCTAAFAADPGVDAVVVGLDPGSPMMKALAKSARPGFDLNHEDSIVQTLPKLVAATDKPVIGIVDGGSLYDPMAERLMDQGVCTFRSCEKAVQALARYIENRMQADRIRVQQHRQG
jgi:acyl-CoA synthetase (NDP forming)